MKIGIINTGGTISSIGEPLGPMSAADFAAACEKILNPIIKNEFDDINLDYITDLTFPESKSGTLDSTNLQPTDWCLMANYMLKNYAGYDGWVVLHGTDSMDFTGSALPFLLSFFDSRGNATALLSKPVIITGSQVPMFYQKTPQSPLQLNFNTDAYQNFLGAIATARTGIAEVAVYFQNHLYRGNRILKTNASEFNAFSSPNYPALAEYGIDLTLYDENTLPGPVSFNVSLDNPECLEHALKKLTYISEHIDDFPVIQFNAFPAKYSQGSPTTPATSLIAQLINAVVSQGIKGLVLESYGEGNFPSGNPDHPKLGAIYQALDEANKSTVIIDCTQVISGVVNNSAYASGAWLPAVGALNPADMTPMTAFAKLMILLTLADINNWSVKTVKKLMQLNLQGEMMNVSMLDSRTNSTLLPGQTISALDTSATLINDQKSGPVLKDSSGTVLWSMLKPHSKDMPGHLVIQNDGNLVFYSRYNVPLWSSETGISSGASSQLLIDGSYEDENLSLQIFNYSDNKISKVLFEY